MTIRTNYETLAVDVDDDGVAWVALSRPNKKNAMSATMIADLTRMAKTLGAAESTRAIVLSGDGDVFCAGGDLEWMKAQIDASRETRMLEARKLADMLNALNQMSTPLIGRIHGGAFGGGVGLVCVCDIAIASEDTKFGLTETLLGLIPATISPYVIGRIGEGMARRVFMSARIFGAEEAKVLGLVAEVVPEAEFDKAIEKQVRPYLSAYPTAVAAAKALALSLGPRIDERVINDTIQRLADTWETPQAREGIEAFLNKKSST